MTKEYVFDYYLAHRSQIREYQLAHRDDFNRNNRLYRLRNPERARDSAKRYRLSHSESIKEYNRRYRLRKKLLSSLV